MVAAAVVGPDTGAGVGDMPAHSGVVDRHEPADRLDVRHAWPIRRRCEGCGEEIEWVPLREISLWLSTASGSGYCAPARRLHAPGHRQVLEMELRWERSGGR